MSVPSHRRAPAERRPHSDPPRALWSLRLEADYPFDDAGVREMLGYAPSGAPEGLTGWFERTEARYRRHLERALGEIERGDEVFFEGEIPFLDAERRYRWLALAARRIAGTGDRPAEVVGLAVDVTRRREAQGGVDGPVPSLRLIADHLPVLIGYVDRDARLQYANRACRSFLGYSRGEALGRPVASLVPAEARAEVTAHLRRALSGRPVAFCARMPDAGGAPRDLEASLLPYRELEEEVSGCFVLVHDVTPRHEAERALRSKSRELDAILELLPTVAFVKDRDNRYLAVNRALADLLALPVAEILGRRNEDLMPAAAAATLDRYDREALGHGAEVHGESRVVLADGRERWFVSTRVPLRDEEGRVTGLAGLCHEITEYKRQHDQHLQEARRQRDALVREVHHRSKNRLQGVLGVLQLQYDEAPSDPLARAIGQIRAVAVVHDLELHAPRRRVRLHQLVQELAASASRAFARPCNVSSTLEATGALAPEQSVPLSLSLSELLTNACKHSIGTEPVEIAIRPAPGAGELVLVIENRCAPEPAAAPDGAGLGLLEAILPRQGARLELERREDRFRARLTLGPPVLAPEE